jgi:hypothetical protein
MAGILRAQDRERRMPGFPACAERRLARLFLQAGGAAFAF